eukprot:scaffold15114_cov146-Isochrysis_galbana.AAC.2
MGWDFYSLAVLSSSQRELANTPEITFPATRETGVVMNTTKGCGLRTAAGAAMMCLTLLREDYLLIFIHHSHSWIKSARAHGGTRTLSLALHSARARQSIQPCCLLCPRQ